jgi:hypothetical protein
MAAQLFHAAQFGIDCVIWTDHDWRMAHADFRTQVSFDSLSGEKQFGKPWTWEPSTSGSPTTTAGGIVTSPVSPHDPSRIAGALRVAVGAGASAASYGYIANARPSRRNYLGNTSGMTMAVDVFPIASTAGGYVEMLLQISRQPAFGKRKEGNFLLSYRIGPDQPGGRSVSDKLGMVSVAAPAGTWTTITIDPTADIAALWPDVDPRDNALYQMWLRATAPAGGSAEGVFDNLRLTWADPASAVTLQEDLVAQYAPRYPSVLQLQSLEYSMYENIHVNGFVSRTYPTFASDLKQQMAPAGYYEGIVSSLHSQGALASYNHPYGTTSGNLKSPAGQAADRQQTAAKLLANGCLGCDILEVGYDDRGGVGLAEHLNLWDTLSRNDLRVVGTGVSDNHIGTAASWSTSKNRWNSFIWATGKTETELLAGVAAGRVYGGQFNGFTGSLDLLVDGGIAMGSTAPVSAGNHVVTVLATNVPSGGTVQVIQGPIDSAGPTSPGTATIATLPATALATGSADVPFVNPGRSFVRVNVVDSRGTIVGFSNPVWMR